MGVGCWCPGGQRTGEPGVQVNSGGDHTHHHSLLAGVGAGTAAVLAAFGLVLLAWRAAGATGGEAVTVIVWAVTAGVVAAVAYGVVFLVLRLRHHVAHPETLTRRPVRAEVIPAAVTAPAGAPAIPAPERAALPPGVHHTWNLPRDPDAAIAVIRAISGRTDQP